MKILILFISLFGFSFLESNRAYTPLAPLTCNAEITDVTLQTRNGCVNSGQYAQICISWSGSITALGITNTVGFTVLSKNPTDATNPTHCFNIKVDNNFYDPIYFNIVGYGDCTGFEFGARCFANCSGAQCE